MVLQIDDDTPLHTKRKLSDEESEKLQLSILKYISSHTTPTKHFKFANGAQFKSSDCDDMIFDIIADGLIVEWSGEIVFNEYDFLHPKLKYRSDLPDRYICLVCCEPFRNPCFNGCGEVYCKECLEIMIKKNMLDPRLRKDMGGVCIESHFVLREMNEWLES
jgi:hypothetical protein